MNFFKTFLAAVLAFIVANILIGIIMMTVLVGALSSFGSGAPTIKPNSVLTIDMSNGIVEHLPSSAITQDGMFGISFNNQNSLLEVIQAIDNAAFDSDIKGIFIDLRKGGHATGAILEEMRRAVDDFKKTSGKFVIAYDDAYSQLGYYFATVADKVFLNPQGMIDFRGMTTSIMFYKGLFDKLGVKVEAIRHGSFKSAIEPYTRKHMSEENRIQIETFLGSVWDGLLEDISASRGISIDRLNSLASDFNPIPETYLENGLVDALLYEDQVFDLIMSLTTGEGTDLDTELARILETEDQYSIGTRVAKDEKKEKKPRQVLLSDYIINMDMQKPNRSKNRIAVVYINGNIIDGSAGDGYAASATVSARLAKARLDDRVKAVVVRVNSPGGSVIASEVMWREIEMTRRTKPVIVSMGSYAASGGYYVSCPADMILADKTTLTGSIGVLGLFFDMSDALEDKLGLTIDFVKTSPSADMGYGFRLFTDAERERMQNYVEYTYESFVNHVAEGRNLEFDYVDGIGGGRIWAGADALENGLIDGIGGLKEAILVAAERADVAGDFRVWEVLDEPDGLSVIIRSLTSKIFAPKVDTTLSELQKYAAEVEEIVNRDPYQAILPFTLDIR